MARDMPIATETNPADRTTLSAGAGLSILVANCVYLPELPPESSFAFSPASFSKKCAMVMMPV